MTLTNARALAKAGLEREQERIAGEIRDVEAAQAAEQNLYGHCKMS